MEGCTIQAPGAEPLKVPHSLYQAVAKMMNGEEKPSGTVIVHFNSGKIFSVEANTKRVFNGQ